VNLDWVPWPAIAAILAALGVVWLVWVVWVGPIFAGDGVLGTIEGYVGRPGQGKTTLAVQDCVGRARLLNAYLVTNVPITAEGVDVLLVPVTEDGIDIGWLVQLALRARAEGRSIVLFLDEVGVWMPARLWQQFGIALMWMLQQSRKLYVEMRWTAQNARFVDAQLRDVTAAVHLVTASPPSTVARRLQGKRPLWMTLKTYTDADKIGSEDVFAGKVRVLYRRRWEGAFDTDAMVLPPAKLKGAEALLVAIREAIAEGDTPVSFLGDAEAVLANYG
jgi:hypothetical protein